MMRAWRTMVVRLLVTLVAPARVASELSEAPSRRRGAAPVVLLGVLWSMFSALLYTAGHQPSFTLLPVEPRYHYLVQAVVVVPLTLGLWWLTSSIAALVAGATDPGRRAALFAALGFVYAGPLIFAYLLVDLLIYGVAGFPALGRYLPFYAPIAPLWTLALGTVVVRETLAIGRGRAFVSCTLGLVGQALVGGVFLR